MPVLSVPLFLLNGFLLFRLWPGQRDPTDTSVVKLTFLVDPLLTAIVSSMASDLYFTPEWARGCSPTYTGIIASVVLILYLSSLMVTFRLTELALPDSPSSDSVPLSSPSPRHPHQAPARLTPSAMGSLGLAFLWSTAVNFALTLILLPVVSSYLALSEKFDSEICQPFFLTEMTLTVFAASVATQISYTGLYFCVCKANVAEKDIEYNAKSNRVCRSDVRTVLLYALTSLLCLISACLFRFIFMTCSCKGLFELTNSLPQVSFLMTLKLPCAALVLHFWPRQLQSKTGKFNNTQN